MLVAAARSLALTCEGLRLCLALLWLSAASRPADEAELLVRVLGVMLAVTVHVGDQAAEDHEAVDEAASEFGAMVWAAAAAISTRLQLVAADRSVDCSKVSPFVLRFQQQVCERWLAHQPAVHAVEQLVRALCKVDKTVLPLDTLYNRLLGSPAFETSMAHGANVSETADMYILRLSEGEKEADPATPHEHAAFERTRNAVVQLLLTIVQTQPSVCTTEQIPRLLLVYYASLAPSDLKLRQLLLLYEEHGCPVGELAAVWGPGSAEKRRAGSGGGNSSGGGGGAEQQEVPGSFNSSGMWGSAVLHSLESFDRRRMLYSIDHSTFVVPAEEQVVPAARSGGLELVHQLSCYDPEFVLPLLCLLLTHQHPVDLRAFVEVGALSYIVMGLASATERIRSQAYSLAGCVLATLELSDLRERRQVQLALTALRDAITAPNLPITPCVAVFIGRAVRIALHPENAPMYPLINKFLLQRPMLDAEDVPLFYNLFNASSDTFRAERIWLLRVLAAGLRRKSDYVVFRRRRVLDLVLNLCDSKLADGKVLALSTQVLVAAAKIPEAAVDLVRNRALLAWLGVKLSVWTGGGGVGVGSGSGGGGGSSRTGTSKGVQSLDGFVHIYSELTRTLDAQPELLQSDAASIWKEAARVFHLCVHGLLLEASVAGLLSTAAITTLRWDFHALVEVAMRLSSNGGGRPATAEADALLGSFEVLFAAAPRADRVHAAGVLNHMRSC
jgi:hypothetical protein